MIDEWGNEVPENQLLNLREKISANRNLILLLAGIFVFTLAVLQLVSVLKIAGNQRNGRVKPTQTVSQITPRAQKKLSPLATESSFLSLEEKTASLSSEIEQTDLYESPLVFPPVNIKVEFEEKQN